MSAENDKLDRLYKYLTLLRINFEKSTSCPYCGVSLYRSKGLEQGGLCPACGSSLKPLFLEYLRDKITISKQILQLAELMLEEDSPLYTTGIHSSVIENLEKIAKEMDLTNLNKLLVESEGVDQYALGLVEPDSLLKTLDKFKIQRDYEQYIKHLIKYLKSFFFERRMVVSDKLLLTEPIFTDALKDILIVDIDNDDQNELLIAHHNGVYDFETGKKIADYSEKIIDIEIVKDTSDNNILIALTNEGYLQAYDLTNNSILKVKGLHLPPTKYVKKGDIDGDGLNELILYSEDSLSLFPIKFEVNGSSIELFSGNEELKKIYVGKLNIQPYIYDFDSDGRDEAFISTCCIMRIVDLMYADAVIEDMFYRTYELSKLGFERVDVRQIIPVTAGSLSKIIVNLIGFDGTNRINKFLLFDKPNFQEQPVNLEETFHKYGLQEPSVIIPIKYFHKNTIQTGLFFLSKKGTVKLDLSSKNTKIKPLPYPKLPFKIELINEISEISAFSIDINNDLQEETLLQLNVRGKSPILLGARFLTKK